jgi:hypothetical protein
MLGISTALAFGLLAWFVGSTQMYVALLPFMDPKRLDPATVAAHGASDLMWHSWVAYLAFNAFIGFLRALPDLGVGNKNGAPNDKGNGHA